MADSSASEGRELQEAAVENALERRHPSARYRPRCPKSVDPKGRSRRATATGKRAAGAPTSEVVGARVMTAADPGTGTEPSSFVGTGEGRPSAPQAAGESLAPAGIVLLVALTITWGVNWPMMKLALAEVPPWTFRSLCLMIGGSALLILARASGAPMTVPRRLLPALALVSLFNITGWHLFSAYALLHTGSGRAAIIGYTMPLWASLLSIWLLHPPDRASDCGAAPRHRGSGAADGQGFWRAWRGTDRGAPDARGRALLGDRHGPDQEVCLGRPGDHRADRLAAADRWPADRGRLVAAGAGARSHARSACRPRLASPMPC